MKPYEDTKPKDEQIRDMFDNIAPRYDLLNHILSFGIDYGWRRRTVRMLGRDMTARQSPRILDLATGTGDLAIMMARRIGHSTITGGDLSPGMLAVAREKVASKGLSERIYLEVTQAEKLPFADGTFDAVTVAFGVRNFHDIPQGLSEIFRVLKNGGVLYVLEFSIPRNKIFGAVYRLYFHRILPLIGGWISGDRKAYTYLPESVDEVPQGKAFEELLGRCGFIATPSVLLMTGVAQIYKAVKP